MSLAALVLRIATVYALRGETLAKDRVLDEPLDPLEDAIGASGPVIAVFAGGISSTIQGRDLIGAETELDLVIQTYLPDGIEASAAGRTIKLDARGSGAAMALNVIERQITRTLAGGSSAWAELWRRFALRIVSSEAQPFILRQGDGGGAVRASAREITLAVETLCDPPIGEPLPELWTDVFAEMRKHAELAAVVDWLELEAVSPGELPAWRQAQASLGLSGPGVSGIGLGQGAGSTIPAPEDNE